MWFSVKFLDIRKIGAIILKDKKILVGKKKNKFIMPGGRIEKGEDDADCLKRELMEEFKAELISCSYFDTFEDESALEPGIKIIMKVYFAEIKGNPIPSSEITDMRYIDSNNKEKLDLGSIIERFVLPKLKEKGIIN